MNKILVEQALDAGSALAVGDVQMASGQKNVHPSKRGFVTGAV
jgi:hypothetical protein